MIKKNEYKLTLDRAVTYQIKVPGEIDHRWSDLTGGMKISVEIEDDGRSITILTGTLDQAALQGQLRQLYSLGLPLISAICVKADLNTTTTKRENENQGTK